MQVTKDGHVVWQQARRLDEAEEEFARRHEALMAMYNKTYGMRDSLVDLMELPITDGM